MNFTVCMLDLTPVETFVSEVKVVQNIRGLKNTEDIDVFVLFQFYSHSCPTLISHFLMPNMRAVFSHMLLQVVLHDAAMQLSIVQQEFRAPPWEACGHQ